MKTIPVSITFSSSLWEEGNPFVDFNGHVSVGDTSVPFFITVELFSEIGNPSEDKQHDRFCQWKTLRKMLELGQLTIPPRKLIDSFLEFRDFTIDFVGVDDHIGDPRNFFSFLRKALEIQHEESFASQSPDFDEDEAVHGWL